MSSIANDPKLAGTVLLLQWLIDDGGVLRVSDIASVLIKDQFYVPPGTELFYGLPPKGGAASRAGSGPSAAKKRVATKPNVTKEHVERAMQWLRSAKNVKERSAQLQQEVINKARALSGKKKG